MAPLPPRKSATQAQTMNLPPMIQFFVAGLPKTAGSKRAFHQPGMKHSVIVDDCKGSKNWKAVCKWSAWNFRPKTLLAGPLRVILDFRLPRPKGHFRTGKNRAMHRTDSPEFHITRPDVLKMARAVEDALTGVIWKDDGQIVDERLLKNYSPVPGCYVTIISL